MNRKVWTERKLTRIVEAQKPTRIQNLIAFALSAPPCYTRDPQNSIVPVESAQSEYMKFVDKRNASGGVDYDQCSCLMSKQDYNAMLIERGLTL